MSTSDEAHIPELVPATKPAIDQLLIRSALQPDLCRCLLESPDEVFRDFDLTEEEKNILRKPDSRLLSLLGAALARQTETGSPSEAPVEDPLPRVEARTLPDTLLVLTVVPCALHENGQFKVAYAVSVNPMPAGGDPASLPLPDGLPGQPLAPLHAVIQISTVLSQDAAGGIQAGLWASFRQSSNVSAPPPPETAGEPSTPPFGTSLDSAAVEAAVAAVRHASRDERYDKLVDLLRAVRSGDVR